MITENLRTQIILQIRKKVNNKVFLLLSMIHAHLELSVATVFQHLVVLLKYGLISETKVGKTKYYYISEKTYGAIKKLFDFVDSCS